jgi:hypothetical protein
MAGASSERQERALIQKINRTVQQNKKNPITIVSSDGEKITGVVGAKKYSGRQTTGSEPYTDMVLIIKGEKSANVSMKGETAPSLAGGGLRGIELASPGLGAKFFLKVFEHLTKKKKLNPGDKVPDVFGQIPDNAVEKIVIGNTQMGGPIDYMYIGPMSVTGTYDAKKNILKLNGNFIEAKKYANDHKLYFRLRARREDQRFDPKAKDSKGVPKIYGKSPSKGDSAGRLVVVDESTVPRSAEKITIR